MSNLSLSALFISVIIIYLVNDASLLNPNRGIKIDSRTNQATSAGGKSGANPEGKARGKPVKADTDDDDGEYIPEAGEEVDNTDAVAGDDDGDDGSYKPEAGEETDSTDAEAGDDGEDGSYKPEANDEHDGEEEAKGGAADGTEEASKAMRGRVGPTDETPSQTDVMLKEWNIKDKLKEGLKDLGGLIGLGGNTTTESEFEYYDDEALSTNKDGVVTDADGNEVTTSGWEKLWEGLDIQTEIVEPVKSEEEIDEILADIYRYGDKDRKYPTEFKSWLDTFCINSTANVRALRNYFNSYFYTKTIMRQFAEHMTVGYNDLSMAMCNNSKMSDDTIQVIDKQLPLINEKWDVFKMLRDQFMIVVANATGMNPKSRVKTMLCHFEHYIYKMSSVFPTENGGQIAFDELIAVYFKPALKYFEGKGHKPQDNCPFDAKEAAHHASKEVIKSLQLGLIKGLDNLVTRARSRVPKLAHKTKAK